MAAHGVQFARLLQTAHIQHPFRYAGKPRQRKGQFNIQLTRNMDRITIENKEIAMMAFDRLRRENKMDSALRLARCLLRDTGISLGIGEIDWDIDTAIRQCGGEPRTGYRYTAHFHFNRKTEMEKDKYDRIVKELYG
ncbi:hypothetical protein BACDOR_02990 [Phocaeicola dorei DSM 17855]|uniref:Uncharacterized protein n=2 Tax=Phocaeicola dorei TaxID=357276 RepID=B6W0B0_9BACT|nr:hypothetical protein BACDOR_02990 [Phocaeicola dorei DSM 17855]